jgi:ComF family protein
MDAENVQGLWEQLQSFLSSIDFYTFAFPPQCISCENQLFDDDLVSADQHEDALSREILRAQNWCENCLEQIRAPLEERCATCGAIVAIHASYNGRCRLCYASKFHFSQAACINNYGGLLQELVIRMKGRKDECLAMQLGTLLGYEMERLDMIEQIDVMAPVPRHWVKKFRNGFQASELICQRASKVTGIPHVGALLKSTRLTEKQGMLSDLQRLENVKGAFAFNPFYAEKIKGKTVALVDDVMTSGATANQCAKALKKAGAANVVVAVVARGAKG